MFAWRITCRLFQNELTLRNSLSMSTWFKSPLLVKNWTFLSLIFKNLSDYRDRGRISFLRASAITLRARFGIMPQNVAQKIREKTGYDPVPQHE